MHTPTHQMHPLQLHAVLSRYDRNRILKDAHMDEGSLSLRQAS